MIKEIKSEKDFMELPMPIRMQALEYYALVKAQLNGKTLGPGDVKRLFDLLEVVCEYKLDAHVCGVDL